jgi:hypothetical protein
MPNINLDNFDEVIDPVIVDRGQDYFERRRVGGLGQKKDGTWKAVVRGTESYHVEVAVSGGRILASRCDCPYDFGQYCKHVVAALYAIREAEEGDGDGTRLEKAGDAPAAPADVREESVYRKRIRASVRMASRRGFIDYGDAGIAADGAEDVLDEAEGFLHEGMAEAAVTPCLVVIREMALAVARADDSDGVIGSAIDRAFGLLHGAVEQLREATGRHRLLADCLRYSRMSAFKGWDWPWEFLRLAARLVADKAEAAKVSEAAGDLVRSTDERGFADHFYRENAAEITLSALESLGDREGAESFIRDNLKLNNIRKMAFERLMGEGDFRGALNLTDGPINDPQNQKTLIGILADWLNLRVTAAEALKDRGEVRACLKRLFFIRGDAEYLRPLKAAYGKAWTDERVRLVREIKARKGESAYSRERMLEEIYVLDGMADELMALVEARGVTAAVQHHDLLAKRFPERLVKVYGRGVVEKMRLAGGRQDYEEAARWLRRMQKLGAREKARQMAQDMREKYPRRRAMVEIMGEFT